MPDPGSECCLGDSEELEEHVATLRLCTEQLAPCHPRTLTAADRLAVAFWLAGYTDQAVGLLDHALDFVASTPGSDYPQRVDLLSTLGEILFEQRHLEPAEAIQREVMEHRIRHLGPNHSAALEAKGIRRPCSTNLVETAKRPGLSKKHSKAPGRTSVGLIPSPVFWSGIVP